VSSRTVFLHQGVIAEEGASSEMFAHPRTERFRQFLRRDGGASH
jgi:octopine/nopaline transport system ATP-binding protein